MAKCSPILSHTRPCAEPFWLHGLISHNMTCHMGIYWHRPDNYVASWWRSSPVLSDRKRRGRSGDDDCCWAVRASSEEDTHHHSASRGELHLKSASVSYSCGGKTPTWRAICRPTVFSLIGKGETCQANLVRFLSLYFLSIRLFELSVFFPP